MVGGTGVNIPPQKQLLVPSKFLHVSAFLQYGQVLWHAINRFLISITQTLNILLREPAQAFFLYIYAAQP